MPLPFIKREQTLDELTEANERKRLEADNAELDFTIAQKRAMTAELKARGLTPSAFGNSWKAIWHWLRQPIGGKKR